MSIKERWNRSFTSKGEVFVGSFAHRVSKWSMIGSIIIVTALGRIYLEHHPTTVSAAPNAIDGRDVHEIAEELKAQRQALHDILEHMRRSGCR